MTLVDAVAATVSAGEAKRLAGNPAVAEVTPDLPIPVASSSPVAKPVKAPAGGSGGSSPRASAARRQAAAERLPDQ